MCVQSVGGIGHSGVDRLVGDVIVHARSHLLSPVLLKIGALDGWLDSLCDVAGVVVEVVHVVVFELW